jgi:hypothetical protein
VAPVRVNSVLDLLLGKLVGTPILTVATAATLTGRSSPAANAAMQRLAEAGILRQPTVGRRNRAFESPEAISAFMALEGRLANGARNYWRQCATTSRWCGRTSP